MKVVKVVKIWRRGKKYTRISIAGDARTILIPSGDYDVGDILRLRTSEEVEEDNYKKASKEIIEKYGNVDKATDEIYNELLKELGSLLNK